MASGQRPFTTGCLLVSLLLSVYYKDAILFCFHLHLVLGLKFTLEASRVSG